VKTIKINNIKVKVVGQKLIVYDPFDDVSKEECQTIAQYLYDEGFFKKKSILISVSHGS